MLGVWIPGGIERVRRACRVDPGRASAGFRAGLVDEGGEATVGLGAGVAGHELQEAFAGHRRLREADGLGDENREHLPTEGGGQLREHIPMVSDVELDHRREDAQELQGESQLLTQPPHRDQQALEAAER